MDLLVDRDRHFGGHYVIFGIWVVRLIQAEEILIGLTDLIRMEWAELAIRPRITEIESKLSGLNLDGHGVRRGRAQVLFGPGLDAENSQRQHLCSDHEKPSKHQALGADREVFDLLPDSTIGRLPDKKCQKKLGRKKSDPSLCHGF